MPSSMDLEKLSPDELIEAWPALSDEERQQGFSMLTHEEAENFISHLSAQNAIDLITTLPEPDQRQWLRLLPPDDVADLVQEAPEEEREDLLLLLDKKAELETRALLEYDEDDAGGLMTPRFAKLRADMTASEAIRYLRAQASQNAELIYYGFVVDRDDRLVGVVSFRELVISPPERHLRELMTTDIVKVPEDMDQEEVSRIFRNADLICLPVIDAEGRIKGIVTGDDIVDVVDEEATEDMHRMGGIEVVEGPYLHAGIFELLRKRGIWLVILLLLGFFTVEAMEQFKHTLATELKVLLSFIPLIISCGGNTGSQAATLAVRAMALGEVRLRDWARVVRREIVMGLGLGAMLAATGIVAALLWNAMLGGGEAGPRMGDAPFHVAFAVGASILCIVLWGTLAGSLLPFGLRAVGLDPASASAPLVATIVDATGLVIYFVVAGEILRTLGT
jgi:magnesium transporter